MILDKSKVFLCIIIYFCLFPAYGTNCIPDYCPFRCCSDDGTCAMSFTQCETCNPSKCLSGCCDGTACALKSDVCGSTKSILTIVTTILAVMVTICLLSILIKIKRRNLRGSRTSTRGVLSQQTGLRLRFGRQKPPASIPIIEVQAPKYEPTTTVPTITSEANEIIEVDHAEFLESLKETKEAYLKNAALAQNQKMSKGVKPVLEDHFNKI